MIENKKIVVENISVVKNKIFINGYKKDIKSNIELIADNKVLDVRNNIVLDRVYVENRILGKGRELFKLEANINKNIKTVQVLVDNKKVFEVEVKDYREKKKALKTLKKVFGVIKKTIKISWERHHFLVPPRMLKQYLASFKNNVKVGNINDIFYDQNNTSDYNKWLEENEKQPVYKKLKYNPLLSVVITSDKASKECIDSISNQSYKNLEVINIKDIKKTSGEYIALVDGNDILSLDALYYVVAKLNEENTLDLVYTDEDKIINGVRTNPIFKPDYSKDLLLTTNYFSNLVVIKKEILNKVKSYTCEYDLFLKLISITDKIGHIDKILYHSKTTKKQNIKLEKQALEDYFKNNKIKAKVSYNSETKRFDIEYLLDKEPKISIIIPTKDKSEVLDKCLKSIIEKTNYKNYEIIVIDNNSSEEKTFNLLKDYESKYKNFKSYRYECPFNYSYLNNEGVKKSKGDYVVLLNNDTEVITPNWLKLMVGYASQKHIGCVGAKLLYPNKTIQHVGVILGLGGVAAHAYLTLAEEEKGDFPRLKSVYDWSCVTAACLMISKEKYNAVNGLDESLAVAYNDVDFNMKNLDKGLYNVVVPQARLFHYESLSRGFDTTAEKFKRFKSETDYMCDKWKEKILIDKYYNNNYSKLHWFKLDRSNSNEQK